MRIIQYNKPMEQSSSTKYSKATNGRFLARWVLLCRAGSLMSTRVRKESPFWPYLDKT